MLKRRDLVWGSTSWIWASPLSFAQASRPALPFHALLIGNDKYRKTAALINPSRDVRLLNRALESRGARTSMHLDLGMDALERTIDRFIQEVNLKGGVAWVSFSGHAVQVEGKNYLQSVDSDFSSVANVKLNGYDIDDLVRNLGRASAAAAVIVVDACRSNPFKPDATRGNSTGLAPMDSAGLFIAFSTAPYMRAFDWPQAQNSPYASALARALSAEPSRGLESVFREVGDLVFRSTDQHQVPEYRSSLRAEWWFNGASVELRRLPATTLLPGASSSGQQRESLYRPDVPAQPHRYSQFDSNAWNEEDQRLMRMLRRSDRHQAFDTVAKGSRAGATAEEQTMAGLLLETGAASVERDQRRAMGLYLQAARSGHVVAQTLLGEAHYERDERPNAYRWISIAAQSGFSRALIDLAQLTLEGHGTVSDPTKAAATLRDALQPLWANPLK